MKLRTQFIINMVVLGSILLLVSAAVIGTSRWNENTHQQQKLATQIEREAYKLGYLANNYLLNFVLIGSLGIFLLVNYGLTFRRILQGIATLQAGFRIIGSGALDYGISIKNEDEIGELFHAFNQMTANLKKEMASRADLEKEIMEHRRAEDESRSLAKFPTENPYPVLRVQHDGRVIYANAASYELLKMWNCGINGYLPAELKDLIRVILDCGSDKSVDVHCNDRVYSITLVPIVDCEYVNLYGSDITARKQAQEHIAYQARLLANVNDAIVGSDAQFRLNAWNASAESMYGWKEEEVLGRNGVELLRTNWPQKDANEMRRMIAETGRWRGEATQLRKDGTWIPVEVSSIVLRDESGQVTGYVSVNRDITQRRQAEEMLARQSEDLRRSNAELEQFAYVASHDLQEPLRMISSYVQLLGRRYQGKLDSDADEFIAFAVDGAKRMQSLINDLLAYSRVGTRGNPYTVVSAEDLVKEALANLQFSIEESGASITHEALPVVKGDPTQLVMVFQNLLGNAIKFHGSAPPCIHIGAQREGDEWIFSVRDNGIGLDPQFAERIFVIFQRLHNRSSYPGTGIGLAICKRIIQRHRGRIWVESKPGEGATFFFTLPVKETV